MNVASRVRVRGPLARYAAGFRETLFEEGYTDSSAALQLQLLAHVSDWLTGQGLDAGALTRERVSAYVEVRRARGRSVHVSERALRGLLAYLRGLGVAPVPATAEPATPAEVLLARYTDYLVCQRALAATTVEWYEFVARRFLADWQASDGGLDLGRLTAGDVRGFLTRECAHRSVGSAKNVASGLRSLLRFLHAQGMTTLPLAQAVFSGAGWSGRGSPESVDVGPNDLACLLRSCDRRRAMGRRDYAILVVLARLGLRAGEVAGLQLDDVDWRHGEILIRGKGGRSERLPLPVDVGEALAAYLRQGRPRSADRRLFVRVPAPHRGLGASGVSQVVYRACDRAGLPPIGAHRLRHAAACELLRRGAPLTEIAQVLRSAQRANDRGLRQG